MSGKEKWLLYGANGYTGKLIAEHIAAHGSIAPPVLGGRNDESVRQVAEECGFDYRVFEANDRFSAKRAVSDCSVVLNCAGPFVRTAEPLARTCIEEKTHYLDITGEIPVFETMASLSAEAVKAGIVLLPGTGFDVVPTDCMALALKEAMPDAGSLDLAFYGLASLSSGTIISSLSQMPSGGLVRRNGEKKHIQQMSLTRKIRIAGSRRKLHAIPWGDIETAWHTTGIKNITVYAKMPGIVSATSFMLPLTMKLLESESIRENLEKFIRKRVKGPDEEKRKSVTANVYGKVEGPSGSLEAELQSIEPYQLTVLASIEAVKRVSDRSFQAKGYKTPAGLFGSDFVFQIPGTKWIREPAAVS